MVRNKWLAWLLVSLMALPLAGFALEAPDARLEGLVTELVEGGFLMEDADLGEVIVNVDEATVLDGILLETPIEPGQYVIVDYSGRLTRSIPPQAHGDKVGCYTVSGTVAEYLPVGFLVTGDSIHGDVIVRVTEGSAYVPLRAPVTVYYDGVMAMSLPGQVTARHMVLPQLQGVVSERDAEGFTLTDDAGESYRVLLDADTVVGLVSTAPVWEAAADDDADAPDDAGADAPAAPAGEADMAAPAATPPADAELDPDMTAPAGETDAPPMAELADGDRVTVYYDGTMTKSLPPQLSAIEVLVARE